MKTLLDRFADKVLIGDECWEWTGAKNPNGYGMVDSPAGEWSPLAHRAMYGLLVGPIPEGLQLDHLCRNRGCVNPDHLEPVTCKENIRRGETGLHTNKIKTECKRGHPFSPENTYVAATGRTCKTCRRAIQAAYAERKRGNL